MNTVKQIVARRLTSTCLQIWQSIHWPFQDKELIVQACINSCWVSLVNVHLVVLAITSCQINQHYQPVVLLHDKNHFLIFSKIFAKCRALSKNDRN